MRRYLILSLLALPLLGLGCINVKTSKTTDGGVFKSDDAAESWKQKVFVRQEKKTTITINNESINNIVFHPKNRDIIYVSTHDNGIYRTEDGGEKWTQFKANGTYQGLSIDPMTPSIIYISQGAQIFKTVDEGKNWDGIYIEPTGKGIVSVRIDNYNTARIWALTATGDLLLSSDWGETWTVQKRLRLPATNLFINPEDTKVMYIPTVKKGLWKSIDAGNNWSDLLTPFGDTDEEKNMYDLRQFLLVEQEPNTIYLVTKNGIYRSWDAGAKWENIKTLQPAASIDINALTVNYKNHGEIYFSIGKIIHKTIDNGENWKTIETFPSSRTINFLITHPENPSIIWAGTYLLPKKK